MTFESADLSGFDLEDATERSMRMIRAIVLGYLAAIAGSELVTSLWSPSAGLVCHGFLLLGLTNHYLLVARGTDGNERALPGVDSRWSCLPLLALVPLLRILSFTMPVGSVPPILWFLLVDVPLLTGVVLVSGLVGLRLSDVGRWTWSRQQELIALTGVPLTIVAFFFVRPEPIVQSHDWRYLALAAIVLMLFSGFAEEVVFRGLIQRSLCDVFGAPGIIPTSLLSAVANTGSHSLASVLFSLAAALAFGWFVYRTGSVMGVGVAHGIINIGTIVAVRHL